MGLLHRLRGLLLATGDKRRQPLDVLFARLLEVLRLKILLARLKLLLGLRLLWLLVLWLLVLWLMVLRLLVLWRIERLRVARCERLALHVRLIVFAVVVRTVRRIATKLARLLLIERGLGLAKLLLRRGDQAEIMLGVLIVVFGRNRVAGTLRIAGQLEIFFGNVRRRSPDFHVRSIGLVHA